MGNTGQRDCILYVARLRRPKLSLRRKRPDRVCLRWISVGLRARTKQVSVRIYGEYAGRLPVPASQRRVLLDRWSKGEDFSREWNIQAPIAPLNKIMARNYPSYTTSIPDVIRAQLFLSELKRWKRTARCRISSLLQLPSNHTNGASPDVSSAKAMVADNDLALGQIVEGLTKSKLLAQDGDLRRGG